MEREPVGKDTREIIAADLYSDYLGVELEDIEQGWARVRIGLEQKHTNFMGLIHGGVIFSLADIAFGAAANSFGTKAMALQVNVDFLAPPRADLVLTAEVELVSRAGKMGFYNMRVVDSGGTMIARCSGWAYHTGRPLREGNQAGS
ncbi:MAG: PaaI family thioesterase [Actinomycetota bacterium]|nr:PaaI family thioesterase [Actinomycetota bacterium]